MTTILLVLGGIWVALSMVFCLALSAAAAKPLPEFEAGAERSEPRRDTQKAINEAALCAR